MSSLGLLQLLANVHLEDNKDKVEEIEERRYIFSKVLLRLFGQYRCGSCEVSGSTDLESECTYENRFFRLGNRSGKYLHYRQVDENEPHYC